MLKVRCRCGCKTCIFTQVLKHYRTITCPPETCTLPTLNLKEGSPMLCLLGATISVISQFYVQTVNWVERRPWALHGHLAHGQT